MKFVDAHCFAGGLALGMHQAGFELVGKYETQGAFGAPNMLANRHILGHDWSVQGGDYSEWEPIPDVPIVAANPPCSSFSLMSASHFRGIDGPANKCMWGVVDFASRQRPQVLLLESVQQAYTQGAPLMRALRERLEAQTGLQYNMWHVKHNALAVGGAAMRKRYMLVLSQVPMRWERPEPVAVPSVMDVIGDLVPLRKTWHAQPYRAEPSWWVKEHGMVSDEGVTDGLEGKYAMIERRVAELFHWLDGDWPQGHALDRAVRACYEKHGDLPPLWQSQKEKILANDFKMGFTLPSRWRADGVSRVITGQGAQQVIHPTLPRFLTYREIARVMGFPDDWRIQPNRSASGMNQWWGKGVTVQVGRWFGEQVKRSLEGTNVGETGRLIGEREWEVDHTHAYRSSGFRGS